MATPLFLLRDHHEKAVSEDKRRRTEFASATEGKDSVEGGKGLASQLASTEDLQGFACEKDLGRFGRM